MDTKTYNGWTNYETWAVKLWMDNDEGTYRYWNKITEKLVKENPKDAVYDLSNILKDEFIENMPDLGPSAYSDLLSAAISEVDWQEIAESLVHDVEVA